MAKNLVIVESPAKAKTIKKYLGKGYEVHSSYGHIADLTKKGMGIQLDNNKFTPTYEVSADKKDLVKSLKKLVKDSETVWLASDEDREGEAIAWHLQNFLDIKPEKTKRIVFNEITKKAIIRAIENPRDINLDLVNAQQARRILDRIVGFELSPVLWKKVKAGLSAGRVQSVVVRLVVEKEREIQAFETKVSVKTSAVFQNKNKDSFKANLNTTFQTLEEAKNLLEKAQTGTFIVSSAVSRPGKMSPPAPFTTSTLQQDAANKLGYSVTQTMSIAQKLYEQGLITYMRTDSVNLSEDAIADFGKEIISTYGQKYSKPRRYSTKSKGAQEAHEAIRPTNASVSEIKDDSLSRLYRLIRNRTLASQMAEAQLENTTVHIKLDDVKENFTAKGQVVVFDGFLTLGDYKVASEELPKLSEGEELSYVKINSEEKHSRPPARYGQASLVKKMEELGIGRPSTYAPTITTIQNRNYVAKEDNPGKEYETNNLILENGELKSYKDKEIIGRDKNKLTPTDIGFLVNDFLTKNFNEVLDFGFTAKVEKNFDSIAIGEKEWENVLGTFYERFHPKVETVTETAERISGERHLGDHPKTGEKIIVRMARFGPVIQVGEETEDKKPKYIGIPKELKMSDVQLEHALKLMQLPREVGLFEGEPMQANIGRFGPYVKHKNSFYSIKEGSPYTISDKEAITIIEEKREADKNKYIHQFEGEPKVEVLNGRYGPYIKIGRKNVKIPKDIEPKDLTREKCLELSEAEPTKTRGRARKKK